MRQSTSNNQVMDNREEMLRGFRIEYYDNKLVNNLDARIFVKGLPLNENYQSLHQKFSKYGEILSSRLSINERRECRGYATIQYTKQEYATKAITENQNSELLIMKYKKPKDRIDVSNIYVKNLPINVRRKHKLIELFSRFGQVIDAYIKEHKFKSEQRAYFGFVRFAQSSDAMKTIKEDNNLTIDDITLKVFKACTKSQRKDENRKLWDEVRRKEKERTLYIKSILDKPLDNTKVRSLLEPYGIKALNIRPSEEEKNNGQVGYAVIEEESKFRKAVKEFRTPVQGILIRRLENKNERRERLINMLANNFPIEIMGYDRGYITNDEARNRYNERANTNLNRGYEEIFATYRQRLSQ